MKYIILFIICGLIWGFSMQLFLIFIGAFIIYWLWTVKKRRANIMFSHIYALVESGQPFVIINDIYFEAALKFALEHGGTLDPGVSALHAQEVDLPINIKGTNYMIGIARMPTGHTWMGAINVDEETRKIKERMGML